MRGYQKETQGQKQGRTGHDRTGTCVYTGLMHETSGHAAACTPFFYPAHAQVGWQARVSGVRGLAALFVRGESGEFRSFRYRRMSDLQSERGQVFGLEV